MWYRCYHNTKYPVKTFVHFDNDPHESVRSISFQDGPDANSTMIAPGDNGPVNVTRTASNIIRTGSDSQSCGECESSECSSYSVGHSSHIPRQPPTPTTYTIPSIFDKSIQFHNNQNIFGMVKLGDDDVCYTSGTIEWVGRKRSFPLNTGFKILTPRETNEPFCKRKKQFNETYTSSVNKMKECDCADILPTVNAIVDHLNALHEAVDLVDLRLNTLEEAVSQ